MAHAPLLPIRSNPFSPSSNILSPPRAHSLLSLTSPAQVPCLTLMDFARMANHRQVGRRGITTTSRNSRGISG